MPESLNYKKLLTFSRGLQFIELAGPAVAASLILTVTWAQRCECCWIAFSCFKNSVVFFLNIVGLLRVCRFFVNRVYQILLFSSSSQILMNSSWSQMNHLQKVMSSPWGYSWHDHFLLLIIWSLKNWRNSFTMSHKLMCFPCFSHTLSYSVCHSTQNAFWFQ